MKTIIFIAAMFLFSNISISYGIGNFYLDGTAGFIQTKDANNQLGGGFRILYQLSNDLNFFAGGFSSSKKINPNKDDREDYTFIMGVCGIEYLYNIAGLPLFWKSAAGFGVGSAGIKNDYDPAAKKYTSDYSGNGFSTVIWTGVLYVFTQRISSFMDIGYHYTYFDKSLKNKNDDSKFIDPEIMGLQILIGVRFTVWGQNKSIYSDY